MSSRRGLLALILAVCGCSSLLGLEPLDFGAGQAPNSDGGTLPDGALLGPDGAILVPTGTVTFRDSDLRKGFLAGKIQTTGGGTGEQRIYFGSNPTTKLSPSPVATMTTASIDLGADTLYPDGATHLLAFDVTTTGEKQYAAGSLEDNILAHRSTGFRADRPLVAYDAKNDKIILAGALTTTTDAQVAVCNPADGVCTARAVGGKGASSLVLDPKNDKLVLVREHAGSGLGFTRCNLDATSCTTRDGIAGVGANGVKPVAFFSGPSNDLVIASTDNDDGDLLRLTRCTLKADDEPCSSRTALTEGADLGSAFNPTVTADPETGNFAVFTADANAKLFVYRCNAIGTVCDWKELFADRPGVGQHPSSLWDPVGKEAIQVSHASANGRPGLMRCSVATQECSFTDISLNVPNGANYQAALALFPAANALFIATTPQGSPSNGGRLSLYRCDPKGAGCIQRYLTAPFEETNQRLADRAMVIDASNTVHIYAKVTTSSNIEEYTFKAW